LKNLLLLLPFYSRDARTKAITLPNGHATIGQRVLRSWYIRDFHFFNDGKKHHLGTFVKSFFTPGNPASRSLSNGGAVLD